jgi:hypothetical protein
MKRYTMSLVVLLYISVCFATGLTLSLAESSAPIRVLGSHPEGIVLHWSVSELNIATLSLADGGWTELQAEGFVGTTAVGQPELPYLSRLITVPVGATLSIKSLTYDVSAYSLKGLGFENPIYPAQPSYRKCQDMSLVKFMHDAEIYSMPDYQKDFSAFTFSEVGFMRGQRLFEVVYTPIKYDPVEEVIYIYENLVVEIIFENADLIATQSLHSRTWSADFERLFQIQLLNYTPPANRDVLMRVPTKYIIISHPPFTESLQPFVEWKTQAGFEVIFATTDQTGTSTSAIKSFIQYHWDAATETSPAPTYLLLVGDTAQIPPWPAQSNPSDHITDLTYVRLVGTSFFPDMYFGRFSANNLTELIPQIEKTLVYEKFLFPDPTYLRKSLQIAGWDSFWSPTHANGQINYLVTHYINATTPHHDYDAPYTFLHPTDGMNGSNAVAIRNHASQGVGWITYTAHGDVTVWDNPRFNISQVYALQNFGKYPVVIGNCCVTGKFDHYECFAEAWLRAPAGGVIYIGGTNNTYWHEDYWWTVGYRSPPANGSAHPYNPNTLGMYDMLFHTHGESPELWAMTVSGMIYAGNMVVQTTNSHLKDYYWEIYAVFGDPSLIPYLGYPTPITTTLPDVFFLGMNNLDLSGLPPFARIAISQDGELLGVAISDISGDASLSFSPILSVDEVLVVISAQNAEPIIQSFDVIPIEGAYIVIESAVNSATGIAFVDFDTVSSIALTVKNAGLDAAENIMFSLSTSSEYIRVDDAQVTVPFMSQASSLLLPEDFTIRVSHLTPDQYSARFSLRATDGTTVWQSTFSIRVNAPRIRVSAFDILSDTGRLHPGESTQIRLDIQNHGNHDSVAGNIRVISTNPDVVISLPSTTIPQILQDGTYPYIFDVDVGSSIALSTVVDIAYFIDVYNQTIQGHHALPIGLLIEDFESGDFSLFDWQNASARPWTIVTATSHEGAYSARAGNISHNQSTHLSIEWESAIPGTISFARRVSSEAGFDMLRFFINNVQQDTWSGEQSWGVVTFPVESGTNTFRWSYTKDQSWSHGHDTAWIDHIIFPSGSGSEVYKAIAHIPASEVNFGNVPIEITMTLPFTLVNLGNIAMSGEVSMPDGFALGSPPSYTVPAFSSIAINISFTASVQGAFSGDMLLTTNDVANPQLTIRLRASVGDVSIDDEHLLPLVTALYGNYPNPFNPETMISFDIASDTPVTLQIYNIRGQKVATLIDTYLTRGRYTASWMGVDAMGKPVSSGVYFYRLKTDDITTVRKMLLLK